MQMAAGQPASGYAEDDLDPDKVRRMRERNRRQSRILSPLRTENRQARDIMGTARVVHCRSIGSRSRGDLSCRAHGQQSAARVFDVAGPRKCREGTTAAAGRSAAKYVTGSITNTSGQKFSFLSVKIILYDSNGERIGGAGDSIQNFEPDQTWKFQALILGDAPVASARVSEIEGW